MGDEATPGAMDALGGLFALSFELLGQEADQLPQRIEDTLKRADVAKAIEKSLLDFARTRKPGMSSQLSDDEARKLRDSLLDGVKDKLSEEYLKQVKGSPKYKELQGQLEKFEKAAKSSALGVWVDEHRTILYIVGAGLALGAGAALYVTKSGGPVVGQLTKALDKLDLQVIKVGSFNLTIDSIYFNPTAEVLGGKISTSLKFEQLQVKMNLKVVSTAAEISTVGGEAVVHYGRFDVTSIVQYNVADHKPVTSLSLLVGATGDNWKISVGAKVENSLAGTAVTGNAAASYQVNKYLSVGSELSSGKRADMGSVQENKAMGMLTITIP
jgi:hypothetical protein